MTLAKTIEANLFHNAVPCAYDLFGSQSYIINDLFILSVLIFIIL